MGVVRSCVFILVVFVELQYVMAQPLFESLICDYLCDDDSSDYDICDGCADSSSSSKDDATTSAKPSIPSQNISIKIPASQGTILDIVNQNGMWSVNVDAQGTEGPAAGGGATTAAPATTATTAAAAVVSVTTAAAGATTAAAGATTAAPAATTAKAR